MERERATKEEYLEWFYHNSDFGPADSDYRDHLKELFMKETKKNLPKGYHFAQDGETSMDKE